MDLEHSSSYFHRNTYTFCVYRTYVLKYYFWGFVAQKGEVPYFNLCCSSCCRSTYASRLSCPYPRPYPGQKAINIKRNQLFIHESLSYYYTTTIPVIEMAFPLGPTCPAWSHGGSFSARQTPRGRPSMSRSPSILSLWVCAKKGNHMTGTALYTCKH